MNLPKYLSTTFRHIGTDFLFMSHFHRCSNQSGQFNRISTVQHSASCRKRKLNRPTPKQKKKTWIIYTPRHIGESSCLESRCMHQIITHHCEVCFSERPLIQAVIRTGMTSNLRGERNEMRCINNLY